MTPRSGDELRARAGKAILAYAVFRLEGALTISLTILLAFFLPQPFPWWHWWYWLILGGIAEVLIIYTSITDERTAQQVVADMLRVHYNPREIEIPAYREKVERALQYRDRLQRLVATAPPGVLQDHLRDTLAGLADWIENIYVVAKRLDAYARDELLRRDRDQVPAGIASLRKALAQETEPSLRQQIQATLEAKEVQLANLNALANSMEEAELRLEATLTALGTVYSQIQLLSVRRLGGSAAQRLSTDIREQVQRLADILAVMDQVYGKL
ncbi:MAG: hypothetical protein H5T69_09985 [Chloroflexi bacterium]|nr:hypothetical protein [Chloroflexota bacterium]